MSAPTVVIMAAGKGTRMRSARPKVLHELCGRPLIGWVLAAAREAGAGRIVVVDGPERALAAELPDGVELAVQQTSAGTADAVLAAAGRWGPETVVVLSADVPLITAEAIRGLVAAHEAAGAKATMLTMELDEPGSLGRVVREPGGGRVLRVAEVKAQGDASPEELAIREVNAGIYAFDGGLLEDALRRVGTDNAQGEAYLPDALFVLAADGHPIATHVADDVALVTGVNDRADLARVARMARARIAERHMLAGVTIVDPEATYIDVTVEIGPDTTIEPGTTLRGRTRIGSGVTIRESYVIDAEIGDGVDVGPYASLRPGTVLRARSKAGTFVEIKNSDVGEGTKVPHLSYVGDADIGPDGNLGAATITANYDGVRKHRTTIGARVHTSVDTTLVAPVTLGDDVYTGAGSVITDELPSGSLGIARPRQTTIEGYADRRREREA
ncbi:MAG TPA: bifunctional UDP-N-acetylglucosamine diphosphorylase/glucosamine-1-phosphate N-acetyltransferase GlmU [Solirubrobacteraceae bacterium]|nr:bifunctional UDP-N-acetylglucosamine diphosphorylase/glucosamine-1-phosphate N-acetyltransferase GlmU [Solirubrobacteraceae bacterium]